MIQVQISIGELIDKLSILEIKKNKVEDESKLFHIKKEYLLLMEMSKSFMETKEISILYNKLLEVNTELWIIEDRIRELESIKKFDEEFIDLARKVYLTNDKRFSIKNEINESSNSGIREVKNYKKYK